MRFFLHAAWLYWFIVEVFHPTLTQRSPYGTTVASYATPLALSCRNDLVFTLNDQCQLTLSPQQVLLGGDETTNWNDYRVSVNDRNPFNLSTVDGVGSFAYLVRQLSTGNIICQGTLRTEDKRPPLAQPLDWSKGEQAWLCFDLDRIYNVADSWQRPDYRYYTGQVRFNDACSGVLNNVKVSDRLVLGDCDSTFFAKIYRNFSVLDAAGNARDTTQVIVFAWANWRDLYFPKDTSIHNCIPETVRTPILYPYWINAVGDTTRLDHSFCNLSIERRTTEVLLCRKGRKVIQTLRIMELCSNTVVYTDTTFIKIGDLQAPLIRKPLSLINLSTQPMSCTANFPVGLDQLQRIHQIGFSDCDAVTLSVKVKAWQPSGFLGDSIWVERVFPVNNGIMSNLPLGKYRVLFYSSDPCGNTSLDSLELRIRDRIAPILRCDNSIRVSVSNGYGRLTVADIDEGTTDNCQIVSLKVRRVVPNSCLAYFDQDGNNQLDTADALIEENGLLYTSPADRVDFFCCDIGTKVRVELVATDLAGNVNRCWQDVPIEDKTVLACQPPPDTVILCNDKNLGVLSAFGAARILNDPCGLLKIVELPVIDNLNNCGAGTLIRRWQVVRNQGKPNEERSGECRQTIRVNVIREYAIRFPQDTSVQCLQIPPGNKLTHVENGCNILVFNVKDERFTSTGQECYKIFRTWRIINWCEYTEGTPPVILDRDYDGNGERGDSAFWLLVKPDGHTYIDKDQDHKNKIPNVRGYWVSSKEQPLIRSRGVWEYTQIIKVYDDEAPRITLLGNRFVDARNNDCTGDFNYLFSVSENCNAESLKVEIEYDEKTDGKLDRPLRLTGTYPRFRIQDRLPIGLHRIRIRATDGCGNTGLQTIDVVVRDAKAPSPICINGLVVELMPLVVPRDVDEDGDLDPAAALIWAKDFIASKTNDCSEIVAYSIHRADYIESGKEKPDPTHTSVALTCDDRPSVLVYVYAWDASGNYGYCETYVLVQDNRALCPSIGNASISGTIKTFTNEAVENVQIGLSGYMSQTTTSNQQGQYSFSALRERNDYSVKPELNTNHLNGVSTYDIVLISKHILGTSPFDSPYKYIAADVDLSGFVSTLDIIQIRKLVLHLDLEFKKCPSWRFIDASHRFRDSNNPLVESFPEVRNFNNLNSELLGADFVAIKMGDISGNASRSNAQALAELRSDRTLLPLSLLGVPSYLPAGATFELTLSLTQLEQLAGAQFSLAFDPKLIQFEQLQSFSAGPECFGLSDLKDGLIRCSWINNGKTDPQLASVKFSLLQAGNPQACFQLAARDLTPEAYGKDDLIHTLVLAPNGEPFSPTRSYHLYPNVPNPFSQSTRIAFDLGNPETVHIQICDLSGRVIKTIHQAYTAGHHEINVEKQELQQTGVLLCTLQAGSYHKTMKMVVY